ncbi:CTI6 [Candida pseudojiufengensis]|uniref:CTI6 n=1 Tax=Candida pseudojiufengensis TaxID=497109 RepID=UPI00222437AC|nr:CTI6 [Candida pseudojiufengensis]KAI5963203.1 CTI6 [Candida pseudojiufengensis]
MSRRSGRRSINSDNKSSSSINGDDMDLDENNELEIKRESRSNRNNHGINSNEDENNELNVEKNDDEENQGNNDSSIEDEEEVTRCICGQDELSSNLINPNLAQLLKKEYKITIDQGLFIQCEKCGVWQHGYCVGLYENEDVPDKYWCEECKPENHILVNYDPYSKRTLYKSVNDKRKKIEKFGVENEDLKDIKPNSNNNSIDNDIDDDNENSRQSKRKRISPPVQSKDKRKERRIHHHHNEEDEYDKQLQKALRESAKESGLVIDESDADNLSPRKRSSRASSLNASSNNSDSAISKKFKKEINEDENESDTNNQNIKPINNHINGRRKTEYKKSKSKLAKKKRDLTSSSSSSSNSSQQKNQNHSNQNISSPTTNTAGSSSSNSTTNNHTINKDEIIQQPYKPRYVSINSSIYDLRKRTSAIIEWISRTKQDLIEEKKYKFELYSFTPDSDSIINEKKQFEIKFNEKSEMINNLSSKINEWELKFGKYAP